MPQAVIMSPRDALACAFIEKCLRFVEGPKVPNEESSQGFYSLSHKLEFCMSQRPGRLEVEPVPTRVAKLECLYV